MLNWKTNLTGGAALFAAVAHAITGLVSGDTSGWAADFMAASAGIGLLFAKDHDVTGGTTAQ